MSFDSSRLQQPILNPVIIVLIDKTNVHSFWTNKSPFVWFFNIDKIYPLIDASLLAGVTTYDYVTIGSIMFGSVLGQSAGNIAEVEALAGSFLVSGKNVYCHCPDDKRPTLFSISLGVAIGYRFGGTNAYYNNLFFDDRAIEIPNIAKAKNNLYSGRSAFEGGSIKLINGAPGELDNTFEDTDYEGNSIRGYFGFDLTPFPADFRQIFTGVIENTSCGADYITISEKDYRKRLTRSIPDRKYQVATWPNLNKNNYDKAIPFLYGRCRNVPVICTNEKESPAPVNYRFAICDTTYHNIETANIKPYVNDAVKTARAVQYDVTNHIAYFEIPVAASEYTPGQSVYIVGWSGGVETTVNGYIDAGAVLIEDALDVIKDLLINYYGILFTDTFFNLAHWDSVSDKPIGILLKEEKELKDWIDTIIQSSFITFITEDDSRFAGRIFNPDSAVLQYISKDDILNTFTVDKTKEEIIAVIKVGYQKDWSKDEYSYITDDTRLEDMQTLYKVETQKPFDTLLTNSTDAQAFATYMLDLFARIKKTIKIETSLCMLEREIGDTVQVEIARPNSINVRGSYKAEIIRKEVNLTTGRITSTLRLFEKVYSTAFTTGYVWGRTFWGRARWNKNYYRRNLIA